MYCLFICTVFIWFWAAAFWLPCGGSCRADLRELANEEMAGISGTGGLSIGIQDLSIYMHAGSVSYTDTDTGNALALENLTISNGGNRPARFATGNLDVNGDGFYSPLTFDIMTLSDPALPAYGKALMLLEALDWMQEVHIHADTLRFGGQDLGSLDIGVIHKPSFYWMLGAHDCGIDLEYGARISIDTLRLTYNDQLENFAVNGIHFGAQDPGAPEDPRTWQMDGMFRIGAVAEGNPATFDVGQGADGNVSVVMNLPMQGSLRVENLQWGGTDFGPMAIDGIQVHRLNVRFIP